MYVRPHLSRARSDSVCSSDEMPGSEDEDEQQPMQRISGTLRSQTTIMNGIVTGTSPIDHLTLAKRSN